MAARQKREQRPLPPPLPPARRTVGQLVGEAIRAYGARFWEGLVLGIPVVLANALVWRQSADDLGLVLLLPTALLISFSYVLAVGRVNGVSVRSRRGALAYVLAVLIFLPVPLFVAVFILPALIWLSLFGLAVPAVLVEGLGVRAALARGLTLARADFIHVLGGLATLAIVVFLTRSVLFFLLRDAGDNTSLIAFLLADIVISPVLFLGGALLYFDQAARVTRGKPRAAR